MSKRHFLVKICKCDIFVAKKCKYNIFDEKYVKIWYFFSIYEQPLIAL